MSIRKIILIAGLAIGLANLTGAASAQQKIVVVNEDTVFAGSKIGVLLSQNLGAARTALADKLELKKLQDELKADQTAIPQLQTMTPEALNAAAKSDPALRGKLESLAKKETDFQQRTSAFGGEIEKRSSISQQAFGYVLIPAVEFVAKAEAADLVMSANSALYVGKKVDISQKVIARLDATVPTLDALNAALPKPPAQPAGGAAPAAGAAAPAPAASPNTPPMPAPTFPKPGAKPPG